MPLAVLLSVTLGSLKLLFLALRNEAKSHPHPLGEAPRTGRLRLRVRLRLRLRLSLVQLLLGKQLLSLSLAYGYSLELLKALDVREYTDVLYLSWRCQRRGRRDIERVGDSTRRLVTCSTLCSWHWHTVAGFRQ